jgi:hypothetical protein
MPAPAFCKPIVALCLVSALALVSMGAAPATLASRLEQHTSMLACTHASPCGPGHAARYIETALVRLGYEVVQRNYTDRGRRMRTLEVTLAAPSGQQRPTRTFVIGASFAPGAGGSGAAAVIELARLLKNLHPAEGTELTFVFFVGARVTELPGASSFIAFAGTRGTDAQVRKALAAFRPAAPFPAEGLAARAYVEGVTVAGSLMITDTALRYPYAQAGDQAAGFTDMAGDVASLARLVEAIAAPATI